MNQSRPQIIPRDQHRISRKQIDENSLKVLYRLHRNGYKAYLVGGSVRDLLLGRKPKDFDIGTDATPNQVRKLFRNSFLVGRRFRLAHIRFSGNQVIEVATFRRHPKDEELPDNPDDHLHFVQNVFGTPEEDAFRRDFTINALFYDISDFSVVDYVGGLKDLEEKRLAVIGDPMIRFAEDPVRMLRAIEFAARLNFTLQADIVPAIAALYLRLFMDACPPQRTTPITDAIQQANQILVPHCRYFSISSGIKHQARELLIGCFRMARGRGLRGEKRFIHNPLTPKVHELFKLWSQVRPDLIPMSESWAQVIKQKSSQRSTPASPAATHKKRRRRSPRRRSTQKK